MYELPIEKRVDKGVKLLTEVFGSEEWVSYIDFPLDMSNSEQCVGGQLAVMVAPEDVKERVQETHHKFSFFLGFMRGYGIPETQYFDSSTWMYEYGFDILHDHFLPERDDYCLEQSYLYALESHRENRPLFGEELDWDEEVRYEILGALWTVRIGALYQKENGTYPPDAVDAAKYWSDRTVEYVTKAWSK